jgi:hypothetical protein
MQKMMKGRKMGQNIGSYYLAISGSNTVARENQWR